MLPQTHLESDGIYFHADPSEKDSKIWNVELEAEVTFPEAQKEAPAEVQVSFVLHSLLENRNVLKTVSEEWKVKEETEGKTWLYVLKAQAEEPHLWDVEDPFRYLLETTLKSGGVVLQTEEQAVGFRTIAFLPDDGFHLNGRKVKFNGVCEHCLLYTSCLLNSHPSLNNLFIESSRSESFSDSVFTDFVSFIFQKTFGSFP